MEIALQLYIAWKVGCTLQITDSFGNIASVEKEGRPSPRLWNEACIVVKYRGKDHVWLVIRV